MEEEFVITVTRSELKALTKIMIGVMVELQNISATLSTDELLKTVPITTLALAIADVTDKAGI